MSISSYLTEFEQTLWGEYFELRLSCFFGSYLYRGFVMGWSFGTSEMLWPFINATWDGFLNSCDWEEFGSCKVLRDSLNNVVLFGWFCFVDSKIFIFYFVLEMIVWDENYLLMTGVKSLVGLVWFGLLKKLWPYVFLKRVVSAVF